MSRKEKLISHFREVRQTTSHICSPLKKEDFVAQPIEDVSPPKWHLGHTSWFFEKFILEKYKPGYQPYNPHYNYLFNSYYETAGERVARAELTDIKYILGHNPLFPAYLNDADPPGLHNRERQAGHQWRVP